jgi:hypothetical protein
METSDDCPETETVFHAETSTIPPKQALPSHKT